MSIPIFILSLFILQGLCLIVGSRASKGVSTSEEYYLAGKGIRFFPLMMTFLATQVGGGLVLGSAEEAYHFGWTLLFYPLGAALGLLILGLGIGKRLAYFPVTTVAQILEVVYGSAKLKRIASVLSIVTLFVILVAQIVGSSKFMVSIGVENPVWFLAFWGMVIFYTAMGGMKAVVATDVIQAAFFMIVFLSSFGYVIYVTDISFSYVLHSGLRRENFTFDSFKLSGWLLMPLLFMLIEQDMGQRCFAGDSPKAISRAAIGAAIATFAISLIPIFFGVLAKQQGLPIPAGASVLMLAITHNTTPILTAFVSCAILAAIISTADSLINAISSNLSQDFGWSLSASKNVKGSQLLSAAIAVLAIFCSYFFDNILDLLIISYELSVSCLFIPIFIGLFKRKGQALSAYLALVGGALGFILFKFILLPFPKELVTIALSALGYYSGEWLSSKTSFDDSAQDHSS